MIRFKDALNKEIANILENVTAFRKEIHMYPELGYKEVDTTKRIVDFLEKNGVKSETFSNITGAIVNIDNNCKKTIALRVDIDALPISENTGLEYTSKNIGLMHACGHDVHTAIGAGLAVILNILKEKLHVNVKIIFQPAEECSPHGGASFLIKEGVLKNPDVSEIYGFHVWPDYKAGQIGVKEGPIMAASDKFHLTIKGKKTHAAQPHKGVDAISIAVDIINAIEFKIKREINPFEPAVISIGQINSTGRYNIICDHVEIEGTIRTLYEGTRNAIHTRIKEITEGITKSYGGDYKIVLNKGYDPVINHPALVQNFVDHSIQVLGENNVQTNITASLIGEDFSSFCKYVPSLYFHLGCDSEYPLHSDKFFPKEETIQVALDLLGSFLLNHEK
ncbi:M20 family metallopeptidase [Clostridiaceae bacterium 35-E11]